MEQHPIQQPIREIDVFLSEDGSTFYRVGKDEVTRIEACQKSGLHADIPYVRVWKGDVCEAEFCQHTIVGVYFAPPEADVPAPIKTTADDFDAECVRAAGHQPGVFCSDCWIPF